MSDPQGEQCSRPDERKTLPFSCPLDATTAGKGRQSPVNDFAEKSQRFSRLTQLSAKRG
jgi:hypothetical protein